LPDYVRSISSRSRRHRIQLLAEKPDMDVHTRNAIILERWKQLPQQYKQQYEDAAAADKARYAAEMLHYRQLEDDRQYEVRRAPPAGRTLHALGRSQMTNLWWSLHASAIHPLERRDQRHGAVVGCAHHADALRAAGHRGRAIAVWQVHEPGTHPRMRASIDHRPCDRMLTWHARVLRQSAPFYLNRPTMLANGTRR